MAGKIPVVLEDGSHFMTRFQALSKKPDIVTLDIHFAAYDSFQTLMMLRRTQANASTPVIALTASVMNQEIAYLRAGDFNGAIAKPLL